MGEAQVFQFKVTLLGIRPPIWRRIQVPCACTFWDLHVAIQDAMGWEDAHLHEFTLRHPRSRNEERIGIPGDEFDEGPGCHPGWGVPLASRFTRVGQKARYTYDFGDGWDHEVLLEAVWPAEKGATYPRCIGGERACPPEDCGGPYGYLELLEAIGDPHHERHDELLEWIGGEFDPEAFDPAQVVFDDPNKRRRKAIGGCRRC